MEVVSSALWTLFWPIAIAVLISVALWLLSSVVPMRPSASVGTARRLISRFPQPLIRAALVLIAVVIATVVGTYFLYAQMVSVSYRALYGAYCEADAVAGLLAQRSGSGGIGVVPAFNGCTQASQTGEERVLSREEVFYLLDRLGLRDPREKTTEDLFRAGEARTRNQPLATALVAPRIYVAGTPTSALTIRLASLLGSGKDIHDKSEPGADDSVCRTAGLAAVMAQQPYMDGKGEAAIGARLLTPTGARTVAELVGADRCVGDDGLAEKRLGRAFEATYPTFPWWPLLTRPTDRISDGGIVTIALNWARAKEPGAQAPPPAATSQRPPTPDERQAIMDFMRNIVSEASAVSAVREGRIAVNFFIGWERLAILVVSAFLVICILWQQAMRIIDERHLNTITVLVQRERDDPADLPRALGHLRGSLNRAIGRSAPREILDAALEMLDQHKLTGNVDRERLRRAAEHEMRILDRSRFFFLAGLPLLPTIGFVGTVRSLIEALAVADNIPRARDAVAQVAAVSDVTATLSLCFSTTFMALTALLLFAPLDLWQSMRERQMIEETERLLDDALLARL